MIHTISTAEKTTILVASAHCGFSLEELSRALGYNTYPHFQPRYSTDDIRLAWFELKILCHTPTNSFHRQLYKTWATPYWKLKTEHERAEQKRRLELAMEDIERAVRDTEMQELEARWCSRLQVEQQRRSREARYAAWSERGGMEV